MPQPMDRLPGESSRAFAAFVAYLQLGPQRSCEKAAAMVSKGPRTCRKWSERHGWVRRAAEYDELCAAQEREIQAVLTKDRAAEWVKRQERLKEEEFAIAERLLAKAKELLEDPRVRWSGGDIAKLLDVASKLGRLASGLETDRREVTGEGGGPVKVEIDVRPLIKRVYGEVIDAQESHGVLSSEADGARGVPAISGSV